MGPIVALALIVTFIALLFLVWPVVKWLLCCAVAIGLTLFGLFVCSVVFSVAWHLVS